MEQKTIKITDILIKDNIRQRELGDIAGLMQSIKNHGLMQPIGVKETNDGKYVLIWGFRRLEAHKKLGYNLIDAIIFFKKDQIMLEEMFYVLNASENLHRKDITFLEFGRVCKILSQTMNRSEIASRLGVSKRKVDIYFDSILRIPEKYQNKIRVFGGNNERTNGYLPYSTVAMVSKIRGMTADQKEKFLETVNLEELTYQQVRIISMLTSSGLPIESAIKKANDYQVSSFQVLIRKDKAEKVKKTHKTVQKYILELLNSKEKELVIDISKRQ